MVLTNTAGYGKKSHDDAIPAMEETQTVASITKSIASSTVSQRIVIDIASIKSHYRQERL
jgi:hypothetical protein